MSERIDDDEETLDASEYLKRQSIGGRDRKQSSVYIENDDAPTVVKGHTQQRKSQQSFYKDDDAPTFIKGHPQQNFNECVEDEKTRVFTNAKPKIVKNFAFLVLINSIRVGKIYKIDENESIIGRDDSKSDIVLTCPFNSISGKHAKIYYENNNYYIYDLNSTNGTLVNGQRIENQIRQAKELQDGDRILVGKELEVVFKKVFPDNYSKLKENIKNDIKLEP